MLYLHKINSGYDIKLMQNLHIADWCTCKHMMNSTLWQHRLLVGLVHTTSQLC